ncbi:MAG TPA: carboxymuconolactone decarboxylase family protein [Myxococcota bacterium]|jgi:AhpD family alkylhydroperoxidase
MTTATTARDVKHGERGFRDHDEASADDAGRAILGATKAQLGFVPPAVARMVEAPALYRAFMQALQAFERTSLSAVEREVVALAVGRAVGCDVCVGMHRGILGRMGEAALAERLASGAAPADARLAALAGFCVNALATAVTSTRRRGPRSWPRATRGRRRSRWCSASAAT